MISRATLQNKFIHKDFFFSHSTVHCCLEVFDKRRSQVHTQPNENPTGVERCTNKYKPFPFDVVLQPNTFFDIRNSI